MIPSPRQAALALAGLGAIVVTTALLASPATAHSELASSDPADGATLTQAPSRVLLTFNEQIQDVGTAVVVTDPAGTRLDDPAELVVTGAEVTVPLDASEPVSGKHRVAYRVVSADGHVISGTITYTLRLRTPTAAPTSEPATVTPTSTAVATPTVTDAVAAAESESSASTAWVVVGAVVTAAVALAVVVWAARRGRG